MVVKMPRDILPAQADPSLLHLNDPGCGALNVNERNVVMKTPLEGCGTVRRFVCHFSLSTLCNYISHARKGSFHTFNNDQLQRSYRFQVIQMCARVRSLNLSDRAIVDEHMGTILQLKNPYIFDILEEHKAFSSV